MVDTGWVQPAALGGLLQRGKVTVRALWTVCSHAFLSPSLAQSVSASPPESLQDEEHTGGTGLKRKREEKDLPGHYVSAPKNVWGALVCAPAAQKWGLSAGWVPVGQSPELGPASPTPDLRLSGFLSPCRTAMGTKATTTSWWMR